MSTQNELTKQMQWENFLYAGAMPMLTLAATQWTVKTWIAQYNHCKRKLLPFRLQWPRSIVFSSDEPLGYAMARVREWGISCADFGSQWTVAYGPPLLQHTILVSAGQWEMADAILFQAGATVLSEPGTKREYQFSRPWGVTAKARSFDEGLNAGIARFLNADKPAKRAKLGKTYR